MKFPYVFGVLERNIFKFSYIHENFSNPIYMIFFFPISIGTNSYLYRYKKKRWRQCIWQDRRGLLKLSQKRTCLLYGIYRRDDSDKSAAVSGWYFSFHRFSEIWETFQRFLSESSLQDFERFGGDFERKKSGRLCRPEKKSRFLDSKMRFSKGILKMFETFQHPLSTILNDLWRDFVKNLN